MAGAFLRVTGWELEGRPPAESRYVLIAAPHTSNWDLLYLLCFAALCELRISWMAKHSLFWPPLGWVFKALGGIPVRRDRRGNLVKESAEAFRQRQELVLVVPVEGTRDRTEHWKSGFYHIAQAAGVPIVMSYLDFGRRRGGFGPSLVPSGQLREDMDHFRAFYADKQGLRPECFGPVRLREEGP